MNEREIIELADACGRRVCSTEHHHGCPYGDKGLTDCVERLEQDYEASVKRLLALLDAVHGDCKYCAHNGLENAMEGPCAECVHFAAKDLAKGDFWTLSDMGMEEAGTATTYICIDQDHNTWRCTACGHMETFEADGQRRTGGTSASLRAEGSCWPCGVCDMMGSFRMIFFPTPEEEAEMCRRRSGCTRSRSGTVPPA